MGYGSDNDDNIPGDIPEKDREEFMRRREKVRRALLGDSAALDEHLYSLAADAVWKASIITGSPLLVEATLKDGVSPDTPLPDESCHPLVSLSRLVPKTMQEATNHTKVAKCLIDHEAKLNIRDYKGLLPADYALLSVNTALAREIVLSTLRLGAERNAGWLYRPNTRALFSAIPAAERDNAFTILRRNIEAVSNGLEQAMLRGDYKLQDLPRPEIDYWRKAKAQPLENLPGPTSAMTAQFNEVTRMAKARSAGSLLNDKKISREDLEAAQDKMRYLEWEHARKFKPA
ncbi:MAG: hypothetical protein HYU57_06120 [Micavibrio aeruginosavorus]|nr:hypothetical protein [Micavibrio aeruginosavorus]